MANVTYTVKKGDTLSEIAVTYASKIGSNLTLNQRINKLVELNDITDKNRIVVGQVLILSKDSSTPSSTKKTATNRAIIKVFGLQSNTDRTVYATWTWTKTNTKNYKVKWYYATGDGIWFVGDESEVTSKQSTYNAPSNATGVKFIVKPISKTHKVNNKDTNYWTADWSTAKTYKFSSNPPTQPSAPSTELVKLKLTARLDNLDINATHIQFLFVYNDTKQFKKSGNIEIKTKSAAISYTVSAGRTYKVKARGYNKKTKDYGPWSDYSSVVNTPPTAPGKWEKVKALSETSVFLNWKNSSKATKYEVQYTTKKGYFDSSNEVQSVTVNEDSNYSHAEITGLETGQEYFFRVRGVNDTGNSAWSSIVSVKLGTKPSPPTTWSSSTTVMNTEDLTLYWLHNSEDGSEQTDVQLEIYFGNTKKTYFFNGNGEYKIKSDGYPTILTTSTRPWYTTVPELTSTNKYLWNYEQVEYNNGYIGIVNPRVIATCTAPSSSTVEEIWDVTVTNYYKAHSSRETPPTTWGTSISTINATNKYLWNYEKVTYSDGTIKNSTPRVVATYTDDNGGIKKLTNYYFNSVAKTSVKVYETDDEKYKTTSCVVDISQYNEGVKIKWRVRTKGIINTYSDWSIQRTIDVYDPPSLSMTLTDGSGEDLSNGESIFTTYPLTIVGDYSPSTQTPIGYHLSIVANESYECENNIGEKIWISSGDEIFSKYYDVSELNVLLTPGDATLSNNINYTVKCRVSMNSGLTADDELSFTTELQDEDFEPNCEISINNDDLTAYICPYCHDPENEESLIEGVSLSVYRREFDGTFKEILTGIQNDRSTWVTDPHPALDYARYRIVAISDVSGHVVYYDVPAVPIQEKAVIIQWDDDWRNFETTTEDPLEEPEWTGSMLKLPYNIDVSDANNKDVELIEYIGRSYPVSYYGTHVGQTATWNVEIDREDAETLYMLRRLSIWMGDVYVREPSGSGYWANISVSFSQKHCDLTIPVTLQITRVMGGV